MTPDLRQQKPASARTLTPETALPERLGFDALTEWVMIVFAFVICPSHANPHRCGVVFGTVSPPPGVRGYSELMT